MKQQFDLSLWLKDKSRKVMTREGKNVKIIHTNSPVPHHPIVGFIDKSIYTWTIDGKLIYSKKEPDKNDLFFADEEEVLTEFEKELAEAYEWAKTTEREEFVNEFAPKLLDLARKEIEKDSGEKCISKNIEQNIFDNMTNLQKCFVKMFKYADYHGMVNAIKQFSGLTEALIKKDLPKWKKITEEKQNYLAYGYLSHDGYYLSIQELKDKLPKDE